MPLGRGEVSRKIYRGRTLYRFLNNGADEKVIETLSTLSVHLFRFGIRSTLNRKWIEEENLRIKVRFLAFCSRLWTRKEKEVLFIQRCSRSNNRWDLSWSEELMRIKEEFELILLFNVNFPNFRNLTGEIVCSHDIRRFNGETGSIDSWPTAYR